MRKGVGVVAGSWLVLAVAFGCGDRGDPLLTGHPGYPAYARFCKRCHGNEGDGKRASRMAERAIDLGSPAYADSADPAAVRRIVAEGRGRMKGYAETLSGEEMDAVSHYVLEMGTARSRPEAP